MPWKTSKPHDGKDDRIGRHVDVYHTDDRGKRDQPHSEDCKISRDESKPLVRDINPPKK
jgi:hypothetical protein